MFGEYMMYINEKPVLLICENTVYVKELDCIKNLIAVENKGFPYNGAKEHYIIDVEDKELLNNVIEIIEKVIPIPIKKSKKKSD
jgi:TfoX/Sxy family transcriptional regulator of competence genes